MPRTPRKVKVARFWNEPTPETEQVRRDLPRTDDPKRDHEALCAWGELNRQDMMRISPELERVASLLQWEFKGRVTWRYHDDCCGDEAQGFSLFVEVTKENSRRLSRWRGKKKLFFSTQQDGSIMYIHPDTPEIKAYLPPITK